jgi:hypothetical protein
MCLGGCAQTLEHTFTVLCGFEVNYTLHHVGTDVCYCSFRARVRGALLQDADENDDGSS